MFQDVLDKFYEDSIEKIEDPEEADKYIKESDRNFHVVMNLPALAVTFLPNFSNLVDAEKSTNIIKNWSKRKIPLIHVYSFSGDAKGEDLPKKCCEMLKVNEIPELKVNFVRDVAPNKWMFRVTFPFQLNFMLKTDEDQEPSAKKQKVSENLE